MMDNPLKLSALNHKGGLLVCVVLKICDVEPSYFNAHSAGATKDLIFCVEIIRCIAYWIHHIGEKLVWVLASSRLLQN
jgi:hypothetical protein